jgi:hypothetical protein
MCFGIPLRQEGLVITPSYFTLDTAMVSVMRVCQINFDIKTNQFKKSTRKVKSAVKKYGDYFIVENSVCIPPNPDY